MGAQGRVSRNLMTGATCLGMLGATLLGLFGSFLQAAAAAGQTSGSASDGAELTSRETQPTFKLQVQRNLVLVRVVVRDAKGRAVGGLRKEDFTLLDNRKPQVITHFSVEAPSSKVTTSPAATTGSPATPPRVDKEAVPETALSPSTPQRYMALFFDDVHMEFGDLARTRDAADRYLAAALTLGDRVGVFTASGQNVLDFTDDRGKLHEALLRLFTRPIVPEPGDEACPQIFDYQAYLIVHEQNQYALEIATQEAYHCICEQFDAPGQDCINRARASAESEAVHVLQLAETKSEYALRGLEQLERRIAALPGQRNIVLVSPGFLTLTQQTQLNEIAERSLHSNIIINTLDAKGLYAPVPLGDASRRPIVIPRRPDVMGRKTEFQIARLSRVAEVLRNLAEDTGGTYFHNSNDLDEGFRRVGALPEVYYVLAFSPQNLKLDGRFHTLKVSVTNPAHLTLQARRGYYAPRKPLDAATQANEEIQQAMFSQDELSELPIDVHTQFFKLNNLDAKLSVLTHVDLRFVRFRKEEGRNLDNLTVVAALFDRDGKYIVGKQKLLQMRLRDVSLEQLTRSGITMKTSFDVKVGTYLVRLVVRDAEGALISALNRTVEIPY